MNTTIKTTWGYVYKGISISGKAGNFRVTDNTENSTNNRYYFNRLTDAKAFIDRNWEPRWVALQNN